MKKLFAFGMVAIAVVLLTSTFALIPHSNKVAETVPPTLNGIMFTYK